MAQTKVPDADLPTYLNAGHTQVEAARHFGVSEAAIHQRLKRLRYLTSRILALEKAGRVRRGEADSDHATRTGATGH
jgi:Zn-dependent peptidase ImmA (M78 family)